MTESAKTIVLFITIKRSAEKRNQTFKMMRVRAVECVGRAIDLFVCSRSRSLAGQVERNETQHE